MSLVQTFPSGKGGGGSASAITATLLSSGWDANNQQALTFTGISASTNGTIGVPITATATEKAAYEDAGISVVSVSGTTITFEARVVPSVDLPVVLLKV